MYQLRMEVNCIQANQTSYELHDIQALHAEAAVSRLVGVEEVVHEGSASDRSADNGLDAALIEKVHAFGRARRRVLILVVEGVLVDECEEDVDAVLE